MNELITDLKECYNVTVPKIGRDFIFDICYYFDLFSRQGNLGNKKQAKLA